MPPALLIPLWLLGCTPHDPSKDAAVDDTDPPVDDTDIPVDDTDDPGGDDTDPPPAPCEDPTMAVSIGPVAYPSLQAALDASRPGDTLTVCPGTWPTLVIWQGSGARTIEGLLPDAGAQVIEGTGYETVIDLLTTTSALTLRHLTVRGGYSFVQGAGLRLRADPHLGDNTLTLQDVRLLDHTSEWAEGPAMFAYGFADVTLDQVTVQGNFGRSAGAVSIDGVERSVTVTRSAFLDNVGDRTGGLNIFRYDNSDHRVDVRVADSTFDHNVVLVDNLGSALNITAESPGPTHIAIERSSFTFNGEQDPTYTNHYGGAVFLGDHGARGNITATLLDNVFEDNIGNLAAHLLVLHNDRTRTLTVDVRGGRMLRAQPAGWDGPGAAISAGLHRLLYGRVELTLTDVDAGTGADLNAGGLLWACSEPLEGLVTGDVRPFDDDWCP